MPIFVFMESNKTVYQFSIVSTWNTVINEMLKQSKLPRGFTPSTANCPPNSAFPNRLKMKQQIDSSIAIYVKLIKDLRITSIITCIDFRLLKILATRKTLVVLKVRNKRRDFTY